MTDHNQEIGSDELDWEHADVREGRQSAAVVSVRLDNAESARLRALASSLGMNLSQVLRQALAAYDPAGESAAPREVFVAPFTYGGTVPVSYEQVWIYHSAQLHLAESEERRSGGSAPTGTEPTRIVERVTS